MEHAIIELSRSGKIFKIIKPSHHPDLESPLVSHPGLLNASRDGDSTNSLGRPFQHLVTLFVKIILPDIQSKPLLVQLDIVSSCPITHSDIIMVFPTGPEVSYELYRGSPMKFCLEMSL